MFAGVDWNDVGGRAFRTFIQSTLATVVAAGTNYVDINTWKAAVIGAGAATLSAVYNAIRTTSFTSKKEQDVH